MEEKIKSKFQDTKQILVYTGSSGDETKDDFKDVLTKWSQCDILIYSPTCESGVNFDLEYFDKMYGMLSDLSTTPRSYFQMLSRVRRLRSNDILILNKCFDSKSSNPNRTFFKVEEVRTSMMLLDGIRLETRDVLKEGRMYKSTKLSAYDVNYIHNRTEQLNASKSNWLSYFHKLALTKGHTIEYLSNKPKPTKKQADDQIEVVDMNAVILATPNINDDEYKELLSKQKQGTASKSDKFKIRKHVLKHNLGLDELNEDVLKSFDVHSIPHFISLIDIKNIRDHDDNQTLEAINRSSTIKQLIQEMGFANVFDNSAIPKETFLATTTNIIANNEIFKNIANTRIRFNLTKEANCKTNKAFLGMVNTILERYSLKIQYFQKKIKKTLCPFYRLDHLNNINELVEYKIARDHKIHDTNNIRVKATSVQYKSLVNFDNIEQIQKDINRPEPQTYLLDVGL